MLHWFTDRKKL